MGQMFQAALNTKQLCELFQVCFIRFLFIQQKRHDNIFFCRQNRKQIKLLKNKSNPFPAECRQLLIAVTVNIFTIVSQRAGRWLIQAGNQMKQGAFSLSCQVISKKNIEFTQKERLPIAAIFHNSLS